MEENFKKQILKKLSKPISDYLKKRQPLNNENDPGEYDSEGSMAKSQLTSIINNSEEIKKMLLDNDNLPEWVQSKITKAEDYISTCKDYLKSESTQKSESFNESFSDYLKKN
jgi:hypothetical protein